MPMLSNQASRFLGGGGGITPDQIAGLQLWLKADAITGLNDGDALTTWTDSSTNGRDVTQAASGEKPTYKTGIINGQPVVRFDGGDVLVNAAAQLILRTRSVFVVLQGNVDGAYLGVLSIYPATGDDNARADGIVYHVSANLHWFAAEGGPNYSVAAPGAGATPLAIYCDVAATTGTLYVNGASVATDATFTTFNVASAGGFAVGGRFLSGALSASYRFNGDIAEIIIYDSALSDANRQAVEAYLSAKYGIALA